VALKRLIFASMAAGATGSVFATWLLLIPTPFDTWVRRIPCPGCGGPDAMDFVRAFSISFALFTFGSVLLSFIVVRACRALRLPLLPSVIAAFTIAAFLGGLTIEIGNLEALRSHNDLTADDASGALLEGGQITPHGWETTMRRAFLAGAIGATMGGAFLIASRARERARA
jgi:hypothetical protein